MKQDRNITINNQYGCNTRTTVGRPKRRATKDKPPVSFGPEMHLRGPQGPGAEARALAELHKTQAQEAYDRALANGTDPRDALRMVKNFILAGTRAKTQYRAELEGSPAVQIV